MQVVRRDRAELVDEPARQPRAGGDLVAVLGEKVGEDVGAVDADAAHPGEVVQADVVDQHPVRLDAEQPREAALEPDRHVAEADGAVPRVEEGARDDADRVREVDDPGVGRRPLTCALGQFEDDRHRAERLGESTRAAITPEGWKLCLRDKDKNELYNLRSDPHEQHNLFSASEQKDVVSRLGAEIRRWQKHAGDSVEV